MILTLDFVAQRYGVLPSRLLAEGSSLDITIADAAQGYANHLREQHEQQQAVGANGLKPAPKMSIEQMKAMIERTRNQPVPPRRT